MEAEKLEYNEHFHWGCFEWMHAHSYLDEEKLTSQGLAKAVIYEACARAKALGAKPVSYTHLDVYKRQLLYHSRI